MGSQSVSTDQLSNSVSERGVDDRMST